MKEGDQEKNKQVMKLQERIEELEEEIKCKQQDLNMILHPGWLTIE